MNRRFSAGALALLLVTGAISGCVAVPKAGRVTVEVQARVSGAQDNSYDSYDVTLRGRDGELIDSREVRAGSSRVFEEVPLGWVSVEAASVCTVESELTSQFPTVRLVIDEEKCTVAG